MQLTYRNFTPADIDALVSFWNTQAAWDEVTREIWEHRFLKTPGGVPVIMLAMHENTIAGQFAFLPLQVQTGEKTVAGYRPFAIIVAKELRSHLRFLTMVNVLVTMYQKAVLEIKKTGASLIYALPNPAWVKALRALPEAHLFSFPLWSVPLPLPNAFVLPQHYTLTVLTAADTRIDALWEKGRKLYNCCAVRSAAMLQWRIKDQKYTVLGLEADGQLLGLSLSVSKKEDKQWLLCDMMATSIEHLSLLVQATCLQAQQHAAAAPELQLKKVAILATPALQPLLAPLGFQKDAYRFPMLLQILDDSLSKETLAPESWYMSAND